MNATRDDPNAPWQREEYKVYVRDVFFLFVILVFSVAVSEQFILDEQSTAVDRIFAYLFIFIPLGTINLIAHFFYRNRRIRRTGNLRSSLRYRLSIAFMLIAVIPSIPIFLLSSDNVEDVVKMLFDADVTRALDSADAALEYYRQKEARSFYERIGTVRPYGMRDVYDARAEIAYLLQAGVLNPDHDYAAIQAANGAVRFETRPLFEGKGLPTFDPIETGAAGYAAARVRGMNFAFYRFELGTNEALVLGHRTSPGMDDEIARVESVRAQYHSEDFIAQRVPNTLRTGLALVYVFMVCAALVLSLLIARQISNPIVSLAAATRAVAEGRLDTRLDIKASGELGILIDSFNQMTGELRSLRNRLLHSQRLAAWREVARRLAHEIRNPLTPIQLSADRMIRRLSHPEKGDLERVVRRGAATIVEQVEVLKRHVDEFANFARLPRARPELQSLDSIVPEAVNVFTGQEEIAIEMRLDGHLPALRLDKTIIIGMINNLIKNAVEAIQSQLSSNRGRIVITTGLIRQGIRSYAILRVEDNGPGIEEDLRERIFEPYYTTRQPGGSGLGLALVERAALEHDARLQVARSASLGGAEFTILFPVPD